MDRIITADTQRGGERERERASCSEIRLITHAAFAKANQCRLLHLTSAPTHLLCHSSPQVTQHHQQRALSLSLSLSLSRARARCIKPFSGFFALKFWWRVSPPPSSVLRFIVSRSFLLRFVGGTSNSRLPPLVETLGNAARRRKTESQIAAETNVPFPFRQKRNIDCKL